MDLYYQNSQVLMQGNVFKIIVYFFLSIPIGEKYIFSMTIILLNIQ